MQEKFACFFVPVYVPKQAGKINSFGTVFCLKLGQSNLSEYLEIERKFCLGQSLKKDWDKKCSITELVFCPSICPKQSLFQEQDWDKKITAVGTKSACDFAESMGQNGREK